MGRKEFYEIVYQKRLVAYLDVMGFKALLDGGLQNTNRLKEFYGQAFSILEFFKNTNQSKIASTYQSIFVSDAIVISVEIPEDIAEAGYLDE